MRLLALDLGTTTGYALGDTDADWPSEIGTWDLGCRDVKGGDAEMNWIHRVDRLNDALYWITAELYPEMIAYEAGFVRGKASELFAGFRWAVRLHSLGLECSLTHRSPTEIKKHATGSGRAMKYEVKAALVVSHGERAAGLSHDAADAVALWFLIRSEEVKT